MPGLDCHFFLPGQIGQTKESARSHQNHNSRNMTSHELGVLKIKKSLRHFCDTVQNFVFPVSEISNRLVLYFNVSV